MTIFIVCAAISIIGILLHAVQIGAVFLLVKNKSQTTDRSGPDGIANFPPVTILKPLKGLDDNLFDNLSSFCTQDYPEYEVLFCLQDFNDQAYKVAKKVMERHPDRNISLVVEPCRAGLNPKVNNLLPGYRKARYPYILISDSNVLVDRNYLRKITRSLQDPSVGLVSNIIRGVGGRSLGAILENLHLNSFILGSISFLDRFLKMPCVIGKSMLMKKADLEALGGLAAFKDILAEDFIIGREMKRSGKNVVLSNYLINNVNEYWGVKRFLNRHTRWGKLRWKIGGLSYLSELLANPVFMASVALLLEGFSRRTLEFAASIGLIKALGDALLGRVIESAGTHPEPMPLLYYCLAPVKDLIMGLLWFVPLLSSTVVWRGNRYIIGKDSRLSPCPETGFWSWGYRITDSIRERFA